MNDGSSETNRFDEAAASYDELVENAVAASGEPTGYFAQYKIGRIKRLGVPSSSRVLDYGCGTGNLTELLLEQFDDVSGFDPSTGSVEVARSRMPQTTFVDDATQIPADAFDVVVMAGVLHHVDPPDRAHVVADALSKVKSGGMLVVFEHNPYNPLTRRAVDQCPFDEGVVLLPPHEVRSLLRATRAASVSQDFIVFFPHALAALRSLEPAMGWLPIGAQTMTVART